MCDHPGFTASIAVNKLADTRDGDSIRCAIDLKVECSKCLKPLLFAFPMGVNLLEGATMSPDGTEARLTTRIGIPKDGLGVVGYLLRP